MVVIMVAFLRKVSALVVAAALILVSSVPAFAATFPQFDSLSVYYDNTALDTITSVNSSATANVGLNYVSGKTLELRSSASSGGAAGYYSVVVSFISDFYDVDLLESIETFRMRLRFGNDGGTEYDNFNDYTVQYNVLSPPSATYSRIHTFTYTFYLPDLKTISGNDIQLRLYYIFDQDFDIDTLIYSTAFSLEPPVITPPDQDLPYPDGLDYDVNGSIGSDTVRLVFNWDYLIYDLSRYWHYNLGPYFTSLFNGVYSSLSSVVSNIGSNFLILFDRLDQQDKDYAAVTDPSTSTEIQETQDMIDSVESFEASLNQNITTEFNKIDFTTPTNLAAPVAYVGDKVTRSINALGNYQPLIFVPLTLGIMLIFLGRGASSLGALTSRRSERDLAHDLGLDRNKNDERWLW